MPDDKPTAPATLTSAKREGARRNAQEHFAATQKRETELRKEVERQQTAVTNQIAKLRALRLAKEQADREAAAAAPKPKPKKSKKKA